MFHVRSVAHYKLPKLQAGFQTKETSVMLPNCVAKVSLSPSLPLSLSQFEAIFYWTTQKWGTYQLLEPSYGAFVASVD